MGARVIDDGQGGLVFTSVTPEDAGTYTCTGSTFDGVDTDQAVLRVGGNVIVVHKCIQVFYMACPLGFTKVRVESHQTRTKYFILLNLFST